MFNYLDIMDFSWFTKRLPTFLSPSLMLAQLTMDYIPIEASDLYDTAPWGTDLRYKENNLSYGSWVEEWTSRLAELSDRAEVPAVAMLPIKAFHMANAITRAPQQTVGELLHVRYIQRLPHRF